MKMLEKNNINISRKNFFLQLPKQKADDVFILDDNIKPIAISALNITGFRKKYYIAIGNETRYVQVVNIYNFIFVFFKLYNF